MTWYAWVLIALFILNAGLVCGKVGQPRKPLTEGDALGVIVKNGLFVWAIIALAERGA